MRKSAPVAAINATEGEKKRNRKSSQVESGEAGMRGTLEDQGGLFSYIAPEARVPANHPLRKIRALVRDVLGELSRSLGKLYASEGRPSIPPEQLLSALLLQVFYASGRNAS
jgi:hypothetical protein